MFPRPMEGPIKSPLFICLSVRQFSIFPRNGSLVFSDFLHNGKLLEYLKADIALFPGKFFFDQIWAKRAQNVPKAFWKILSLVFPGNGLKLKANIVIDISPPVPYLAIWSSSYGSRCCWLIKLQDSLKCNISRKKWMTKFIFGMHINIEVFYKLILSFWVCIARHPQSTQNNKFAISLQYIKEEVSDDVDFLYADQHESFLQIDTMIFDGDGQIFPEFFPTSWFQHYGHQSFL